MSGTDPASPTTCTDVRFKMWKKIGVVDRLGRAAPLQSYELPEGDVFDYYREIYESDHNSAVKLQAAIAFGAGADVVVVVDNLEEALSELRSTSEEPRRSSVPDR